jgi:hypothetical protein
VVPSTGPSERVRPRTQRLRSPRRVESLADACEGSDGLVKLEALRHEKRGNVLCSVCRSHEEITFVVVRR